MFKKLVLGLSLVVAAFVVYVALRPAAYHIERTTVIAAPADVVWRHVSDFNEWPAWNPWQKSEPDQQLTISGEPGQPGHRSAWQGETTGTGSMTISEATALQKVSIKLEFNEPMESVARTDIAIAPQGSGVAVTWSMDGENDFLGKMFDVLMDMESMIGGAYEQGLADLKTIAESQAAQ